MSELVKRQKILVSSGFARVSRHNPCGICGKPDWCVFTRDGEISICMRVSAGAIRMNRQGGFIHKNHSSILTVDLQQPSSDIKDAVDLAPLEVRHAVYSELIRVSPVSNYDHEMVSGTDGLLSRGFLKKEIVKFGALPPETSERDKLSYKLNRFVRKNFPSLFQNKRDMSLVGIPGFWQEPSGKVRLWKKVNYEHPFLIVPYRDGEGRIQACQLRATGEEVDKKKRYCWLSSAGELRGVGTGDPIHFTFVKRGCSAAKPLLITEGGLKAEAFVSLRPGNLVIATSGVSNSRDELIAATRGRDLLIGFDIDHRSNPSVCGQLAALIAERARDADANRNTSVKTKIVIWEGDAKGIDDAARAGINLRMINVADWPRTLEGEPLARVDEVWGRLNFQPEANRSDNYKCPL